MQEHLTIRNAALNNLDLDVLEYIDLRDMKCLTQTRKGGSPFALGPDGLPKNVDAGDRVWVAQAGYGVIGTVLITNIHQPVQIRNHEDVSRLKKEVRSLEATYWESLRDLVDELKGKSLGFIALDVRAERVLETAEHFRLTKPKGMQSSWFTLTEEMKASLFAKQGQSVSAALLEDETLGEYGVISPKVKYLVRQIWSDLTDRIHADGEVVHLDHLVPKALGGPGCLIYNVIPLPGSQNVWKQHAVPPALPMVAHRWKLLSDEEHQGWGAMDDIPSVKEQQRDLTKRVTATMRKRPVLEQKRFYFEVMEYAYGASVRERFARHNALP